MSLSLVPSAKEIAWLYANNTVLDLPDSVLSFGYSDTYFKNLETLNLTAYNLINESSKEYIWELECHPVQWRSAQAEAYLLLENATAVLSISYPGLGLPQLAYNGWSESLPTLSSLITCANVTGGNCVSTQSCSEFASMNFTRNVFEFFFP